MTTQHRRPGRPRSAKSGFQAVRVSNDVRRSLRMVCAEFELSSIDQGVEVLLALWDSMPVARQRKSVRKVVARTLREVAKAVPA